MTSFPRAAVVAALVLVAGPVRAACDVSSAGVSFGAYDTFGSTSLDGTGSITVTCDVAYALTLSSGAGSYAGRTMASGGATLDYNLYVDSGHTLVWGDGSGGSSSVAGAGSASPEDYTVYGRIPAHQNVPAGSYSDSIVVTLSF